GVGYPCGRSRRRRPLHHPLGSPEVAGPTTNRRCRQIRSGAHRLVRLSRHRRTLRRRDFGGDGRGRGASLMAGFPEHPGPAGQARRARGDPGDHHATRGHARHPQQPDLDAEVHLPRRTGSVNQSSARNHAAGQHITLVRHDRAGRPLRRNTAALAGAIYATPKDTVAHRLRRGLRADVGPVPGGPGGRVPVGQPQRLSVDVRQPSRAMIVDFAVVSGASVAALLVVHTITVAIGHRIGRYNVVDVAWGLGFIAVATVAAVLGSGDPCRRWLLLVLVAIWGLRLSGYINRRSIGHGEDPRYTDLLRDAT